MCSMISEQDWADETKTFLEPSFGNGNILLYIIQKRIQYGIKIETVL